MLDPTKLIPEELVPVRVVARLTLDRVVTNVFAETEQVAFMTQNIVPGIDFSDDPLLQGRNFSYLDTQLKRLGSTNFSQLPVNAPRCPVAHFQRDGHMQGTLQEGRANYEPNSFTGAERGPRADTAGGFATHPDRDVGPKRRIRAESFADHYSQAKLFWDSQTPVEQDHIVAAFEKGGALVDLIGPSVGLEVGGRPMDHAVAAAPSALFDAVALLPGSGAGDIADRKAVQDFVSDAFGHLKVIGHDADAAALLEAAGLAEAVGSDGVLAVEESSVKAFWEACGGIRVWDRDVRP